MQLETAVVTFEGLSIAIIAVDPFEITTPAMAQAIRESVRSLVPDYRMMPLVVASRDIDGALTLQGKSDLVHLVDSIDADDLPWSTISLTLIDPHVLRRRIGNRRTSAVGLREALVSPYFSDPCEES